MQFLVPSGDAICGCINLEVGFAIKVFPRECVLFLGLLLERIWYCTLSVEVVDVHVALVKDFAACCHCQVGSEDQTQR